MNAELRNLVWCTSSPSPYNDDFFSSLARRTALSVCYTSLTKTSHPWKDQLGGGYSLRAVETTAEELRFYYSIITSRNTVHIFAGWGIRQYIFGVLVSIAFRKRYFLFTDAPKDRPTLKSWFESVRSGVLRFMVSGSSGILSTGELAKRQLLKLGFPEQKIINLPYILDEARFPLGRNREENSGTIRVVSSGRLVSKVKGCDLSLRAFANASKRISSIHKMEYIIAGDGPDMESLQLLAKQLGVSETVRFVGWKSQDELRDIYSSGDIYLHLAKFEPYGVTVVEALYSGLCAVCSATTGAAIELIQNGVNGWIVLGDDIETAAVALETAAIFVASGKAEKAVIRAASLKWSLDTGVQRALDAVYVGN